MFVLVGKKVLQASTLLLVLQILGGDHVDAAPFQGDLRESQEFPRKSKSSAFRKMSRKCSQRSLLPDDPLQDDD